MISTPHKLFRDVLAKTDDPLAAIRAVREIFGLSVVEAKEVWLQAIGRTTSLDEHQEKLAAAVLRIVCPTCLSDGSIARKVHALPRGLGYDGTKEIESPGRSFVKGYWCSACQTGFVPEHLLEEFGLVKVRPI